jgi:hypothetical protein
MARADNEPSGLGSGVRPYRRKYSRLKTLALALALEKAKFYSKICIQIKRFYPTLAKTALPFLTHSLTASTFNNYIQAERR